MTGPTPSAPDLLSDTALTVFRLNGQILEIAETLSRPAGLTATRWQVLGAVLHTPRTVSDIARVMGITRQSVQRTADHLEADGMVAFRDNPAHRRAKLVSPTDEGIAAVRRISTDHRLAATTLADRIGLTDWAAIIDALHRLSAALADDT